MRRLAIVSLLLAAGCAGGVRDEQAARLAFITDTLVDFDRALVAARPGLVAGKYGKMAETLQTFLRGTPVLWYRDHTQLRGRETVLHGDGAELVQVYGDLHLENVGASFDQDGMLVDCTDFDATMRAPFDWELRRAALGVAVMVSMGGGTEQDAAALVDAMAASWLGALEQADADNLPPPLRAGALGRVFEDVLSKAKKKRDQRDELAETSKIGPAGRRVLLRDGVELADAEAPFDTGIAEAIEAYRATRKAGRGDDAFFVVKDFARKLQSGVASFANLRFYALVEGDSDLDSDDVILEIKEQRDSPLPIGLLGRGPDQPSNAARVIAGSHLLMATPGVDPDLGRLEWKGVSFQVRRETAGRRNLKVDELANGLTGRSLSRDDLVAMARAVGTLLGTAHARGGDAAAILRAAGAPEALRADTVAASARDLVRIRADYDLFKTALIERGPLLGAR